MPTTKGSICRGETADDQSPHWNCKEQNVWEKYKKTRRKIPQNLVDKSNEMEVEDNLTNLFDHPILFS